MAQAQTTSLLEYIRGMLAEADADKQADRELLERFSADHDEIAFNAILKRHGPMVLRVSRRMLERREDAEDVFQATFLVLARKAGSLRWRESIGPWLYSVANRLAQEARRKHSGRVVRESRASFKATADPLSEVSGRELIAILDEELIALAERHRAPLLFHLEGMSAQEAARRLGCSASTFTRRLRRARELLQNRLKRRGFTLSAVLAALLVANSASAKVPPALAYATAQAAVLLRAGETATASLVLTRLLAFAAVTGRALTQSKIRVAISIILATGLLAGALKLGRRSSTEVPSALAEPVHRTPLPPVAATIETTLPTAPGKLRQLAFDGDQSTYFASTRNPTLGDHFTLVFDRPVSVYSLKVLTGRPEGSDRLDAGMLEVSEDGLRFEEFSAFAGGEAGGEAPGRLVQAIRVQPTTGLSHPLAIREFAIDSDPPVAVFKYPVEFGVDVTDAPEMRPWAEKVARICERAFPMIHEELNAKASKPPQTIMITLKNNFRGICETENGKITGSVKYFKNHPDDVGAIVFTTVCCVGPENKGSLARFVEGIADQFSLLQADDRAALSPPANRYRLALQELLRLVRYLAGLEDRGTLWLELGIADYVRFYKYEPGKLGPLNPARASYRVHTRYTAAFLAYLTEKYDSDIVRKLRQVLRAGKYHDEVFQTLTGKTLQELNEEWRASLRHDAAANELTARPDNPAPKPEPRN